MEYFDDETLAKQFEAVRRSGVVDTVDRSHVMFLAHEAGYDELETWIKDVEADQYLLMTEEWVTNYRGDSIEPFSTDDVIESFDEPQQDSFQVQA